MKRKPLKVLVCLYVIAVVSISASAEAYNGTGAPMAPGIQGEALSADPTVQTQPQPRSQQRYIAPQPKTTVPSSSGTSHKRRGSGSSSEPSFPNTYQPRSSSTHRSVVYSGRRAVTAGISSAALPVQASATGTPVMEACGPASSRTGGLGYSPCVPILPRVGCKQFQGEARVWYARLNSSTVQWGTIPGGFLANELDLNANLGLRRHEYVGEFIARCQLRSNWGVRYTFMPIHYRDNFTNWTPFYFGNFVWGPGWPMLTEWDRQHHTWELVYTWFQAPHAVSSVFAGYRLVDDRLKVSYPQIAGAGFSRTRSQNAHLASAGISVDKVITRLGGCATASVHCQWSIQFLESYVGWDGYGVGRVSVPMNRGRFGYLEAGWKWLVLERSQPSNIDKTSLDGAIATIGMVF